MKFKAPVAILLLGKTQVNRYCDGAAKADDTC